MAVIVRRQIKTPLGNSAEEIVYRSMRQPLTKEDVEQAERLDRYLADKMSEIYDNLKRQGLLESQKGNLSRWHAVGRHLSSFLDDPTVIPIEDRAQDEYIWEALWAHAPEGVRPGPPNKNTGTLRDHFRLCYKLAQFPFEFAEQVGPWADWVNFLETPAVIEDERILDWVSKVLPQAGRGALRALARILRKQFKNRDLSFLNDEELQMELGQAWDKALAELAGRR